MNKVCLVLVSFVITLFVLSFTSVQANESKTTNDEVITISKVNDDSVKQALKSIDSKKINSELADKEKVSQVSASSDFNNSDTGCLNNKCYTKSELIRIYDAYYKSKLPIESVFGTISKVEILDDGSAVLTGYYNKIMEEMPALFRMQLEQKSLEKLKKSYCKKVNSNKLPFAKIKSLEGVVFGSTGKELSKITYTPKMCRMGK
jgi:hypothetical protein